MPFDPTALQSDLEALFAAPPATAAACAAAWSTAIAGYAADVVPASTTVELAAATLETALATAFASESAAPSVDAALMAFAAQVAVGMLPGFTGAPPPAPLGIASLLLAPQETHAAAAAAFAALIDAWFRTGSAVSVPPGVPPVTVIWS